MQDLIEYLQLGANGFALIVAAWVYLAYIKNLRSGLELKNEQLAAVQANLQLWKDKAEEFEKQTPGYLEGILSSRIATREEEIKRLEKDTKENTKLLATLESQLIRYREELESAQSFGRALTYYDIDTDSELVIPHSEVELEVLGEVFVDSGQLMVTDPHYIVMEWDFEKRFGDIRLFEHQETGAIYQYGIDFKRYDEMVRGFDQNMNDLLESGTMVQLKIEREYTYDYGGTAAASSSDNGYGELLFAKGHGGAGVSFRTVNGDGGYIVYGERYKGSIVRVFIDLQ